MTNPSGCARCGWTAWELTNRCPCPPPKTKPGGVPITALSTGTAPDALTTPNGGTFDDIPAANRQPLLGADQGGLLAFVDGTPVHHESTRAGENRA